MSNLLTTHWGTYYATVEEGNITGVQPVKWDKRPSSIGESIPLGIHANNRVRKPSIRAGFLKHGARSRETRGLDPFVEVDWETATTLVAEHLRRVVSEGGNQAIYGGSYGWSSAGRFHHAQSQIHRFLNAYGGYTYYKDTYSVAAGRRIAEYIIGDIDQIRHSQPTWEDIGSFCELFISFGGLPIRNSQVNSGSANDHAVAWSLDRMTQKGVKFINISPARDDLSISNSSQEWISIRPGSDTAFILACAYILITENLYDKNFIAQYTTGYEKFANYVIGKLDNQPKTPKWAAQITGCDEESIANFARYIANRRTFLNMAWSLQRAENGEQPLFALVSLASLLGKIGLPGLGVGFGYSTFNDIGSGRSTFSGPRLPQGINKVTSFIPVARSSDLLMNPGVSFNYDGKRYKYPKIQMVYWAGGNAFHHQQDLNKLMRAWRQPEVVITHEAYWTAQAKFSDIVLPATVTMERNDIGCAGGDGFITAMKRLVAPVGLALDDFEIFRRIASKLGFEEIFTEGRDVIGWLRYLYDESRDRALLDNISLPSYDEFWENGVIELPLRRAEPTFLEQFRKSPESFPLNTPSGRVELYSETLASFKYKNVPGHAAWIEPEEFPLAPIAQKYPLQLITPQPESRLHSQYDHGIVSQATKIRSREPMTINNNDASSRGIRPGDIVRVYNDRGSILAGAVITDSIRPGVVRIATGAWYDPVDFGVIGSLDKHGNPNVLTRDVGSSELGQGCSAQSVLVEVELFHDGDDFSITAYDPPELLNDGA